MMPAFTVNRGYPYSIPADAPADVPVALQSLAEAVEADLQSIEGSVPTLVRPIARLRGTTPQIVTTGSTFKDLQFDTVEFNLGGALAAGHDPASIIVTPILPGFWMAIGSVTYQTSGSSPLNEIGCMLRGGVLGNASISLAEQNTHVQPPLSDSVRNFHVAAGQFCDGSTTAFRLRVYINRASGTAPYTFLDHSLTIFRMTQT